MPFIYILIDDVHNGQNDYQHKYKALWEEYFFKIGILDVFST